MGESGDGLHLDGVHLLERVVKDTRGVDDLPSKVLVVHVSDEERFGGERILDETRDQGRISFQTLNPTHEDKQRRPTGWTSTSARVTLLMKDDFPTLG